MEWNIHVAGMIGIYMVRKYNHFFFRLESDNDICFPLFSLMSQNVSVTW